LRKSTRKKKAGHICSDINKSINSQNTFEKRFLNGFSYSLRLTTVVFIAKAHNCNENDGTKKKLGNHATWKCSLSHQLCVDIMFIKTYGAID